MRELFAIRKKKKRNSQGKDLRTFEENSQGARKTARVRTKEPLKETTPERAQTSFQGRGHKVERCQSQERKKSRRRGRRRGIKKNTKCKRSTRTRWWSKIRKSFC